MTSSTLAIDMRFQRARQQIDFPAKRAFLSANSVARL